MIRRRAGRPMDAATLRKACRRAIGAPQEERMAIVRPHVASDPEESWVLLRGWLDAAEGPGEVATWWPLLRALVDLGDDWRSRVATAALDDPRLANCLEAALSDAPELFDALVSRELLVETWVRYRTDDDEWDFWPSGLLYEGTHRWGVEGVWRLVTDIADACEDPELLVSLGELHLDELLYIGPPSTIDCVEREAARSANLRQALSYVYLGDLADDVAARIGRIAELPPGRPSRD